MIKDGPKYAPQDWTTLVIWSTFSLSILVKNYIDEKLVFKTKIRKKIISIIKK